jgi:hypothetical protein
MTDEIPVIDVLPAYCVAQLLRQYAPNLRKLITIEEPCDECQKVQANIEWLANQPKRTKSARAAPDHGSDEEAGARSAKRRRTGEDFPLA